MRKQLADAQWKRIEDLLPGKVGDPGRSGENNRMFVEAVLWIARTGSPWRDLPPEFGSWNSSTNALRAGLAPASGIESCLAGARAPISRGLHRLHHRSSPPACRWCLQKTVLRRSGDPEAV